MHDLSYDNGVMLLFIHGTFTVLIKFVYVVIIGIISSIHMFKFDFQKRYISIFTPSQDFKKNIFLSLGMWL